MPVVLLVEDEPLIRMMLAEELKDAGYHVLEAANGEEALLLLGARPDVAALVTDVRMPGDLDGFAVAREAAALHPGIAIIVASGHAAPVLGDLPTSALFMRKPFATTSLVNQLTERLAMRRPGGPTLAGSAN